MNFYINKYTTTIAAAALERKNWCFIKNKNIVKADRVDKPCPLFKRIMLINRIFVVVVVSFVLNIIVIVYQNATMHSYARNIENLRL